MMKNRKQKAAALLCAGTLALTGSSFGPSAVSAAGEVDYGDALKLSLYFFDANECGSGVDANPLTWRGNCHTYDAEAPLSGAQGLGAGEIALIKAANGGKDTVDVSGGYHDAGDHLKFSVTMGYAATGLAWSYYEFPEAYKNTGSRDHLFDILKTTCDYLMKVTYLDENGDVAAFCYQVGDAGDHDIWTAPEGQTLNRPTYWSTPSHPSADAAGQMASALASSSMALRETDAAYADKCLEYAKALRTFAAKYPEATYDGIGSFYPSSSQKDDVAWSDLWCHIADGTLSSYTPVPHTNNGEQYNGEYDCWIYSWDKVWGGYAALLAGEGFTDYTSAVKGNIDRQWDDISKDGYYPIGGGWGASRYNCAWQMYCLYYSEVTGQTQYADSARKQMDYILGSNPAGRSYMLGYTSVFPSKIHHRAANPDKSDAAYVCYGALVGGPTDANGSYDDNTDSYSCTEPALDYNGSLAFALAGLYSLYGNNGDGSGTDAVIAAAPEIDETHVFGKWMGQSPEIPTEPDQPVDGDYSGDGVLDVQDVQILQAYLLGKDVEIQNADVTGDGLENVLDLCLLKRMVSAK